MRKLIAALALSFFPSSAFASAPMHIRGRIEKVRIEVTATEATLVIDGRFITQTKTQRPMVTVGRMHYRCDAKQTTACLLAWNDLAKNIGDKCVMWGQHGDPMPKVITPMVTLPDPTPWAPGLGVAVTSASRCADLDAKTSP